MSDQTIPFGKYKGKDLITLLQDKSYSDWLQLQPWLKEKYPTILNFIQLGQLPRNDQPTPEHNKLQAKFLNDEYSLKFFTENFPKIFQINRNVILDRFKAITSHFLFDGSLVTDNE